MSTVDAGTPVGPPHLDRAADGAEVVSWDGTATAPSGSPGYNPAFDVTPARLISAIATEAGVVEPGAGDEVLFRASG